MAMNALTSIRQKHRTSEFRDITLEKQFLGCILKDAEVFRKIISNFNSDVLSSDKVKWVYDKSVDIYRQEGIILDYESFTHVLDVEHKDKRSYLAIWKSIEKSAKRKKASLALVVRTKLLKMYQARLIEIGMKDVLTDLAKANKGDMTKVETAVNHVSSIAEKIQIKEVPISISDPFSSVDEYIDHHKNMQKNPNQAFEIKTGIKPIDDCIGGLRRGELGLVTAGTGVGKSILLMDMATYAWNEYGDIVYVTIEMPADQLRQRLYCRLSGISYEYFRRYKLDEDKIKRLRRVVKKAQHKKQKFHIIDMPESCPVDMIKVEIEQLMTQYDIKAIFVDYLNIICSKSGEISLDWQAQVEVSIMMKQKLCRYFQLPTWTANQFGGAADGKEYLTRRDVAFAKNIFDNVDVGFYIAETETTSEDHLLIGRFLKKRDFKGESFKLTDRRDFMRFSNYMPFEKKSNEQRKIIEGRKIKT